MNPAAREDDPTQCPQHPPAALPPHSPPTLQPAATREVFINGRRAGSLADQAICSPSPKESDVVAEGASTVLIGQLPAAALSFATMHGGSIVGPCSPDVFVGGPVYSVPSFVEIGGDATFKNKVIRDLFFLSTTETGRAQLRHLQESGRKVTIRPLGQSSKAAMELEGLAPWLPDWMYEDARRTRIRPDPEDTPIGAISDSTIYYDPDTCYATPESIDPSGLVVLTTIPPQVGLFHELVHAGHYADGTALPPDVMDPTDPIHRDDVPPMMEEEARTIGRAGYGDGYEITENTLRDELGLSRRDHIVNREQYAAGPTSLRPGEDK